MGTEILGIILFFIIVSAVIWAYSYPGKNDNLPDAKFEKIGQKVIHMDKSRALGNVLNYAKNSNDSDLKSIAKKIKLKHPSEKLIGSLYDKIISKNWSQICFARTISQLDEKYNNILMTESDFLITALQPVYSMRLEQLQKQKIDNAKQEMPGKLTPSEDTKVPNDVKEQQDLTVSEDKIKNDKAHRISVFSLLKNKKIIVCVIIFIVAFLIIFFNREISMIVVFRLLTYISAVLVILHYGLFVFGIKDLIWDIKHKCRHPLLSYKQTIIDEYENISRFEKLPIFLCIVSIVLVFLSSSMFLEIIGYHHLALKDPGTYSFQVEISRTNDDQHNTYYLPAEISVELESNNNNSRPYNNRSFYVKKIYFNNGGYLYFQDDTEILVDWPSFIVDQDGCEWECTLINQHYPTQKIKESTDITTISFIFLGIQVVPSFIILLFFLFKK